MPARRSTRRSNLMFCAVLRTVGSSSSSRSGAISGEPSSGRLRGRDSGTMARARSLGAAIELPGSRSLSGRARRPVPRARLRRLDSAVHRRSPRRSIDARERRRSPVTIASHADPAAGLGLPIAMPERQIVRLAGSDRDRDADQRGPQRIERDRRDADRRTTSVSIAKLPNAPHPRHEIVRSCRLCLTVR